MKACLRLLLSLSKRGKFQDSRRVRYQREQHGQLWFLFFKTKVRVVGSAYEPTMRFWLTGRDNRNFCLNVSLAAIVLLLGRTSQEDEWMDGQTEQERQRVIRGDGRIVL